VIPFRAFETLISIISGSREREKNEHDAFMEFYRNLVAIVPDNLAKEFGGVKVPTRHNGVITSSYNMELNAVDCMWWSSVIQDEGGRFAHGITSVQRSIWDRFNQMLGDGVMTDDERMALMALQSCEPVKLLA
jgi:hypothetical protein